MEISFDQKSLRKLCEDPSTANSTLGDETARTLRNRLADIRAIDRISTLPIGNPQYFGPPEDGLMSIDLSGDYKLIFCANHSKLPISSTGEVDWSRVSRIRIMGIKKHVLH